MFQLDDRKSTSPLRTGSILMKPAAPGEMRQNTPKMFAIVMRL